MQNMYVIRDEVSYETGDLFCLANDAVLSRSMASVVASVEDADVLSRMRDSVVYHVATVSSDVDGFPIVEPLPRPRLALRVSAVMNVGDSNAE